MGASLGMGVARAQDRSRRTRAWNLDRPSLSGPGPSGSGAGAGVGRGPSGRRSRPTPRIEDRPWAGTTGGSTRGDRPAPIVNQPAAPARPRFPPRPRHSSRARRGPAYARTRLPIRRPDRPSPGESSSGDPRPDSSGRPGARRAHLPGDPPPDRQGDLWLFESIATRLLGPQPSDQAASWRVPLTVFIASSTALCSKPECILQFWHRLSWRLSQYSQSVSFQNLSQSSKCPSPSIR